MSYTSAIAANVRAEASRRDITNQELSQVLGFSTASVSKRMNGHIEFKNSELEKIAKYMKIPLEVLTRMPSLVEGGNV